MAHTTVRISNEVRVALKELAGAEGATLQRVLERAVEEYRRRRFFDQIDAGYAELRRDDAEWARVCEDRGAWDATLADGLEEDGPPKPPEAPAGSKKRKR